MKEVNTGRAVGKQVQKSPLVVKGVDYKEVVRYVAGCRHLCGDLSEVENVLPWRRKSGKGGRHPGMQSKEMKGKTSGLDKVWEFPSATPTEYQQRILRSRMAEIGVRVLWTNFMYEFAGETFLQMEGGPIGSRVTMVSSRLVMQDWSEGYLDILEKSGVRADALKGYVDDGRQNTDLRIRGSRYKPREEQIHLERGLGKDG